MTATAISLHDYAEDLRGHVPPGVDREVFAVCQTLISEMHGAIDAGNMAELRRLIVALDRELAEKAFGLMQATPVDLEAMAKRPPKRGVATPPVGGAP
jgi:hypothetical protein